MVHLKKCCFHCFSFKIPSLYKLSCPGWCFSRGNKFLVSMLVYELFYRIDNLLWVK